LVSQDTAIDEHLHQTATATGQHDRPATADRDKRASITQLREDTRLALLQFFRRHELTTTPAFVSVAGYRYTVEGVAGPWPVEERWWDSRRRRRCVRMQMLVRTQRNTVRVFLLSLENSEWKVLARYD
jgi:protein ImuB